MLFRQASIPNVSGSLLDSLSIKFIFAFFLNLRLPQYLVALLAQFRPS
jgi:hypothetical protein